MHRIAAVEKTDKKSLDKDGFSYRLRHLMMEREYEYGESM